MTLLPNVFFVWVSDRWQIAQSLSSVFWGQRWQVWKLQRSSWKVSCHKAGLSLRSCILQHPCVFLLVLLGLRCRSKERKKHSSTSQLVITNSSNHFLLPPNQFISDVTMKWYTIPGYNSLSPELVLSVFLNPINLSSNQVLRLWYGEDLANHKEQGDNGERVCADVYSTYDWEDSIKCFYRTCIPYTFAK